MGLPPIKSAVRVFCVLMFAALLLFLFLPLACLLAAFGFKSESM